MARPGRRLRGDGPCRSGSSRGPPGRWRRPRPRRCGGSSSAGSAARARRRWPPPWPGRWTSGTSRWTRSTTVPAGPTGRSSRTTWSAPRGHRRGSATPSTTGSSATCSASAPTRSSGSTCPAGPSCAACCGARWSGPPRAGNCGTATGRPGGRCCATRATRCAGPGPSTPPGGPRRPLSSACTPASPSST
uniref:SanE n=1 Tax=Streptomyces ansochromogenes TaxID=115647 RepID=Q9L730_9ACTN|nr:SanE [Streptomyces ansochromogenes]